jgi:hypothetical protein
MATRPWLNSANKLGYKGAVAIGDSGSGSYRQVMDLDDLLQRYFATSDLSQLNLDVFATGIEKCQVDLGLEQDPGKRFALWALLHMLGSAPDLDATLKSEDDRNAARTFMELLEASHALEP